MFNRKKTLLVVALFMIGWTIYTILNREHFIREHLTNQNPTLFTLQASLDSVNEDLQTLKADYQNLKQQGQAQGSQAAAAMASLQAIPAASPNRVQPTR
jgi:hypothetical protein